MSAEASSMQRPKRWPLVNQAANRSESFLKDARLVNCFAEKDPNTGEYQVQKRIGYTYDYKVDTVYILGSGIYAFANVGTTYVFSIFSSLSTATATMFRNNTAFGTIGGLDFATYGNYLFTEDQASPTRHLIFTSGLHVFYTTGATGWTIATLPTGVAYPIVGITYLDQTIYIMDSAGNIWGSAFNDPSTWPTLNTVIANAIPGVGVGLISQLNYVLALKSNSMEVFYDAANPTGSPLSPVAGALSNYGCVSGSAQAIDDVVLFVTSNKTISPQVVRVDNLQITPISTPAIERLINTQIIFRSWVFKYGGHRYYGLTGSGNNLTLVYDIDQKLWYQWTDPSGNFWPPVGMAFDGSNRHVLQGLNDGNVYTFAGDYDIPTDNLVVAPVDIYTPNTDFGTRRRKTLHRMYFECDQTPGSVLYVSRSDDDYQNFSIPRRVDLSRKTPYLDNEGTFIRRAYRFRQNAPTAFRIRAAALQMDFGVI